MCFPSLEELQRIAGTQTRQEKNRHQSAAIQSRLLRLKPWIPGKVYKSPAQSTVKDSANTCLWSVFRSFNEAREREGRHIDQHWPTLANIDQHWPTLTNIDQHRPTKFSVVIVPSPLFLTLFMWCEAWRETPFSPRTAFSRSTLGTLLKPGPERVGAQSKAVPQ